MSENGQTPRCQAITETGERCSQTAQPGSQYCDIHAELESEDVIAAADVQALAGSEAVRQSVREALQNSAQVGKTTTPEPAPGLFTTQQLSDTLRAGMDGMPPEMQERILSRFEAVMESEWLQKETWQGIGYVAQIALQMQADFLKRRLTGEYEVDKWGYDPEVAEYLALIAGLVYKHYWRVEINGVDYIPNEGKALMVANHSGVLPFDGAMIAYGVREHHAAHRVVRALVANLIPTLPIVSTLLNKGGQVVAHPDNGKRLLAEDELVLVFPEGYKGVGKRFKDRYKLARFGRGGFVRLALEARAPILPVSVVGAEEIYPMVTDAKPVAKALGLPFFPITPTFPWLGLIGFVPLPTKWYIDVGEPIDTSAYDDDMIANPAFVSELTDLVRDRVQEMVDDRLVQRKSPFVG